MNIKNALERRDIINSILLEGQNIINAKDLPNKKFIDVMMDKIKAYDLLSEEDLEILTDRSKGRELFKCDYSYFKYIENESDLDSLIRDGKGITRYYSICHTLKGKKYVVTSQLYDGKTHPDSKTPFCMWVLDKFKQKYPTPFIHAYLASNRFTYTEQLIKNLYLSLKSKPFVILAGISGTGKSKLARLFAEAINAEFKMISVRPDWSDSTDLFGYVDLHGNFQPGVLTLSIKEANQPENIHKPYIICLDEMNLAVVEHYFSDVLSVMETRKFENGNIVSERFIEPALFRSDLEAKERYGSIYFSQNLYFIGTVNMDETTHSFSKKVLDRANTIELSEVNLKLGLEMKEQKSSESFSMDNTVLMSEYFGIQQCYSEYKEELTWVINILSDVNEQLQTMNAQIAYRVRDEICYYVSYALKYNLFSKQEAMDLCLMQKILPRINGRGEEMRKSLVELFNLCLENKKFRINSEDQDRLEKMQNVLKDSKENAKFEIRFPLTANKVVFMLKKCEGEFGNASYWL